MQRTEWKALCHFGHSATFEPHLYKRFEIEFNPVRNKYKLINESTRNEIEVEMGEVRMEDPHQSLYLEFITAILSLDLPWIRVNGWVDTQNFKIMCCEIFLNVDMGRYTKWEYVTGFYRFIYLLSKAFESVTLFYGSYGEWLGPSDRTTLTTDMRLNPEVALSTTIRRRMKGLAKDIYFVSGVPGVLMPFFKEGEENSATYYVNTFTRALRTISGSSNMFVWKISGILIQIPYTTFAHEFIAELMEDEGSDDESEDCPVNPSLMITNDLHRWEREASKTNEDDEIIIIQNWADFRTYKTSDIKSADMVVVAMGLYTSERYQRYLQACVWSILDNPSDLKNSVEGILNMESFVGHNDQYFKRPISRFEIANARSIWNSTKNMGWCKCFPFELGEWNVMCFDDISSIPPVYFDWFRGFSCSLAIGFTTQKPNSDLNSKEWKFMKNLCLDIAQTHIPPFPNPRDILEGCFLHSNKSHNPNLKVESHAVPFNMYERYILSRVKMDHKDGRNQITTNALADIWSNPWSHFQCVNFQDFYEGLKAYYTEKIFVCEEELEKSQRAYQSELAVAARLRSIPEKNTDEKDEKMVSSEAPLPEPDAEDAPVGPPPSRVRGRRPLGLRRAVPPPPPPLPRLPPPPADPSLPANAPLTVEGSNVFPFVMRRQIREGGGSNPPLGSSSSPQQQLEFLLSEQNVRMTGLMEEKYELERKVHEMKLQWSTIESKLAKFQESREEEICSVCKYERADTVTVCFHQFCSQCVWRMFSTQSSIENNLRVAACPICRNNLPMNQIYFVSEEDEEAFPVPVTSLLWTLVKDTVAEIKATSKQVIVVNDEMEIIQVEAVLQYFSSQAKWDFLCQRFSVAHRFGDEDELADEGENPLIYYTTLNDFRNFPVMDEMGSLSTSVRLDENTIKTIFQKHFNLSSLSMPTIHSYLRPPSSKD